MSEQNQNESAPTNSTSTSSSKRPDRRQHSRLHWLVVPAFIGFIIGLMFDTFPFRSVGAGFGGLIGLAIGILFRAAYRKE